MLTATKLNGLEVSEFSTNEIASGMISDEVQEAFPEKRKLR
mgnify:CR=1 FL=1